MMRTSSILSSINCVATQLEQAEKQRQMFASLQEPPLALQRAALQHQGLLRDISEPPALQSLMGLRMLSQPSSMVESLAGLRMLSQPSAFQEMATRQQTVSLIAPSAFEQIMQQQRRFEELMRGPQMLRMLGAQPMLPLGSNGPGRELPRRPDR